MKLSALNESLTGKLPCKAPWGHLASDCILGINFYINRYKSKNGPRFHLEYRDVIIDETVKSEDIVEDVLYTVFTNFVRKYISIDAVFDDHKKTNWNASAQFIVDYPQDIADKIKINIGGKDLSVDEISKIVTDPDGLSRQLANRFVNKTNSVVITIDKEEALKFEMSLEK